MTNYQIGNDAFASFGRFGRLDVRKGKVVNVSPNGTIRVDFDGNQISYNRRNGFERGGGYAASHLIDAEEFARLEKRMAVQRAEKLAVDRIAIAAGVNLNATNRAEIIAKLEAAIKAVNAIPYEDA